MIDWSNDEQPDARGNVLSRHVSFAPGVLLGLIGSFVGFITAVALAEDLLRAAAPSLTAAAVSLTLSRWPRSSSVLLVVCAAIGVREFDISFLFASVLLVLAAGVTWLQAEQEQAPLETQAPQSGAELMRGAAVTGLIVLGVLCTILLALLFIFGAGSSF